MTDRLNVFLVDDNPDDRVLILRELRKEFSDVQAEPVLDEVEFQRVLRAGAFDVVLTDYRIRWTDGLSVLERVKDRYPHCPVIMFTGTGTEETAVAAMKGGLDDYVVKKPSHFVRLATAVRMALERAEARRRAANLETRLATLLSKLRVGAFQCTVDGRLLEANHALLELTGFQSLDEARNADLWGLFPVGERSLLLADMLATDEPQEHEVQMQRRDGTTIWVRLSESLSSSVDGETVIDGLLEDITPRKKAEQDLRRQGEVASRLSFLTPREQEVMKLVVDGKPNKSIARELGVSAKTIEMHRANLMKKLRVGNVAELVKLALVVLPN